MKLLNGREVAGYMKEGQAHRVRALKAQRVQPKLIIIRDSDNPVIEKYVNLKRRYGEDIGVVVEDWQREDLRRAIAEANADAGAHGMIVQLPLKGAIQADGIVDEIDPAKDVDGLGRAAVFDSATATAINWLLASYGVDLANLKIALVGHGKLIGKPLERMWQNSGYDVTVFGRGSDLQGLRDYDLIVSATGTPHLIKSDYVKPGAIIVDGGTASEGGVLVGDVDDEVRARDDLGAITPKIGGLGPLTVATLFEHVVNAAEHAD